MRRRNGIRILVVAMMRIRNLIPVILSRRNDSHEDKDKGERNEIKEKGERRS